MKTITQLKEELGAKESEILTATFDLAAKAKQVDVSMSATMEESLGRREFNNVVAAEREAWVHAEREKLRAAYEKAFETYQSQKEARAAEVEELLFGGSRNASPELLLQVASASEEQLRSMMDMALEAGNAAGAQVAFHGAHQREMSVLTAHYLDANPEAADLYAELLMAEEEPDYGNPGDRFERFAATPPTKETLMPKNYRSSVYPATGPRR